MVMRIPFIDYVENRVCHLDRLELLIPFSSPLTTDGSGLDGVGRVVCRSGGRTV